MKIQIRTNVLKGKFKRNINQILDAVASFEGKDCIFSIEKVKKTRSNNQNRYYHGVIIPIVKNCLKEAGYIMNNDEVHELLKLKFLREVLFIDENTGDVTERVKSTTELSTSAFMDYASDIRQFTLEYFNTDIPEPNEEIMLNFDK